MITLKTLRAFISEMPDDTKMGIDDDQMCLVFREPHIKRTTAKKERQK